MRCWRWRGRWNEADGKTAGRTDSAAGAWCMLSAAEPDTLVMIIESSPTNLDPRVGN